jgi:hypothetical protein
MGSHWQALGGCSSIGERAGMDQSHPQEIESSCTGSIWYRFSGWTPPVLASPLTPLNRGKEKLPFIGKKKIQNTKYKNK